LLSCQSGREKVVSSCVEASAVAILVVSLQQQQYVLSFSERGMLSGNGQVGVYCYVPSKVAQTRSLVLSLHGKAESGVRSLEY
jgi:poly(3-hydroxybutyrate) depolymerase